MTEEAKQLVLEKLKEIKPGVNYPKGVQIKEVVDGKTEELSFALNSFFVGMYCAIHINGAYMPHQTGDCDNKKFVRGLKKDILKAVERGAEVTIGALYPVKTEMT